MTQVSDNYHLFKTDMFYFLQKNSRNLNLFFTNPFMDVEGDKFYLRSNVSYLLIVSVEY